MMNIFKAIFLPLALIGIILQPSLGFKIGEEKRAEQIIQAYMDANGLDIKPGTKEYKIFMRDIFWGEYPNLTNVNSEFLAGPTELDYVVSYAWKHSGYKDSYSKHSASGVEIEEAILLPDQSVAKELAVMTSPSDGRAQAISYAYQWSTSGNANRNPVYPDFGVDDCTNFVSQAMKAGGFFEVGSGDGCKYENTNTEWYVEPNPSPSIFCLGDDRYWEWSTSWSVPDPFRYYFAYENSYAISHGWITSATTAKYYLSPGDVVQMQYDDNGTWVGFHTMIVTDEDSADLYMTYHSNAGGFDEVDKPLSSITLQPHWRFVLVEIKYPWTVFLPLVLSSGGTQGNAAQASNPYPAPAEYREIQQVNPYPAP